MLRHIFPVVSLVFVLFVARQIYPYSSFNSPDVPEGYKIEVVEKNLGGPTCLEWFDASTLIVCDRDDGKIFTLDPNMNRSILITGLDRPHDVAITEDNIFVSEAGKLSRYSHDGLLGQIQNRTVLIDGIKTWGNHQTNAVNILPNGTLVWHSGSTCNVCDEDDQRNAALLWVNGSTGEHILLAEGGDYGWPNDTPSNPYPKGSIAPVATWTPHSSMNGVALRPPNSPLPGGNTTVYATVYGSWNSIIPQGQEIVRIDLDSSSGEVIGTTSVFAEDLGTPVPIAFHPNGDLYFAVFGSNGKLYKISADI